MKLPRLKDVSAYFNFSVKFEIESQKGTKRTGVALVIARSSEEAAVAFNDLTKKDKEWRKHKVLITELPKVVVTNLNSVKPVDDEVSGKLSTDYLRKDEKEKS